VLAEATTLIDEQRFLDALELLAEAVSGNPKDGALLEQLSWSLRFQGYPELALAVLDVARPGMPMTAGIVSARIDVLAKMRLFHRALTFLESLPADLGRQPVVRDAIADVYRTMGLTALAADTQGRFRPWRREWWTAGIPRPGLPRRRLRGDREALCGWPPDPDFAAEELEIPALLACIRAVADSSRQVEIILARADKLVNEGELTAAAEALAEGLGADPDVALLTRLAFIEELRDRNQAELARYAEARCRRPGKLDIVRDEAHALTRLSRFRAALALLGGLPEADRRDRRIRAALAGTYQQMGLPLLARRAYGDPGSLGKYERRERRRSWWRAGGPLRRLLWKPLRFENNVLYNWRFRTHYLKVFGSVDWPSGFDPTEMLCRLDWHCLRWELATSRVQSVRWWLGRAVQIVAVCSAGYGLFRLAGRIPGSWPPGLAAAGIAAAYGLYRVVFLRLAGPASRYTLLVRGGPAAFVLLGGGYALARIGGPAHGWCLLVGGVLIAAVGLELCQLAVTGPIAVWWLVALRRYWGRSPREDILDELASTLDDLSEPSRRNDLEWRATWANRIERGAVTLERRLPAALSLSDETTRQWAAARASGAAAALRRLKRHLAAPVDGSWDRLEQDLRHEVVALVTGDLGKLHWTPPPSRAAVRRSWWRWTAGLFTTIGLAVAPLLAVLAAQPLLDLDGATLRWAKVAGLGWGVLYLLIAADPKLREKIETAQSVSNLLASRRTRPSDGDGTPENR
jgi:tetratricopeptide (TPR) repeat protein